MQAIVETLFDICYLATVLSVGVRMIRGAKGSRQFELFGWMAVVLGAGDSFHLVPRALRLTAGSRQVDHFGDHDGVLRPSLLRVARAL